MYSVQCTGSTEESLGVDPARDAESSSRHRHGPVPRRAVLWATQQRHRQGGSGGGGGVVGGEWRRWSGRFVEAEEGADGEPCGTNSKGRGR